MLAHLGRCNFHSLRNVPPFVCLLLVLVPSFAYIPLHPLTMLAFALVSSRLRSFSFYKCHVPPLPLCVAHLTAWNTTHIVVSLIHFKLKFEFGKFKQATMAIIMMDRWCGMGEGFRPMISACRFVDIRVGW